MAKAKHTGATRAQPKSQIPGWVWLFTGIVTGLFIAFLAYLADITPERAPEQVAKPEEKPAAGSETRFDFYTLLPEREVIVPTPKEEAPEPVAESEPVYFILQAGSFKKPQDAERRRAQVILLGLEARIETVQSNGDTWHRVQAGPFTNRSQLAKARQLLVSEGIDTLLLKRKAEG